MNALGNLRGKLILGLILGLVVVAGLSIYADFTSMLRVLRDFEWWLLPLILLCTLFNYGLRFFKWDVYLPMVGATGVSKKDSLLIFLSGMAMAMTPGKVGEVLKSYLLKQVRGTPIAASAPVVLAERLTDGVAMLILATAGFILFDYGRPVMVGIAIFVLLFLFVFQNRALFNRLLVMGERVSFLSKRLHHFQAFYNSSYELFRLRTGDARVGLPVLMEHGYPLCVYPVRIKPYRGGDVPSRRAGDDGCEHYWDAALSGAGCSRRGYRQGHGGGRHPPHSLLYSMVRRSHRLNRPQRRPAPPGQHRYVRRREPEI
jgi:hypothetical protein